MNPLKKVPLLLLSFIEILEYAKFLGMDIDQDRDLLYIAEEGVTAYFNLSYSWKLPYLNLGKLSRTMMMKSFISMCKLARRVLTIPWTKSTRKSIKKRKANLSNASSRQWWKLWIGNGRWWITNLIRNEMICSICWFNSFCTLGDEPLEPVIWPERKFFFFSLT